MVDVMLKEELFQLEKIDLHCHLDGSLSVQTIQALAKDAGIQLPKESLLTRQLIAERDCQSLAEYLEKFDLPLQCLTSKKAFQKAAYDLVEAAAKEHVSYMEIRFAPLLSETNALSASAIIEGVLDGLHQGEADYPIRCGLILCGMRHMSVADNLRVVRLALAYRKDGVCALDLAGDEASFPVTLHKKMFEEARRLHIPFTIHAGECGSPESMWHAIKAGASRLGHGIAAIQDPVLMQHCAKHQICLEMCPTSNFQTKAVKKIQEYPLLSFLEAGIPVSINTDNRTVSNTTLTEELYFVAKNYGLSVSDIKELIEYARRAAFSTYAH